MSKKLLENRSHGQRAKETWRDFGNHAMRAQTSHDESAAQDFMIEMYRHLNQELGPGRRDVYEVRIKPEYLRKHGRLPRTRHEVREAVKCDPFFRYWSHLRAECNQELFHRGTLTVEKQAEHLSQLARATVFRMGSLELDPNLEIPAYQSALDMHWMPGSYHSELTKNDIAAGALYDAGGIYVMTSGNLGPYNDGAAYSAIAYLRKAFPNFRPGKILDQGCTVGHNTLPFKDAWPKAAVTGIDLSASVLRYAHARSVEMGYSINYSQQNAEQTKFDDKSFDLITSTMFLHETSHTAVHNIVKENYRLLKPGGMMVHVEQPPFRWFSDPFEQFTRDWDTHNNNEPFWGPMHDMDLRQVALEHGFVSDNIIEEMIPLIKPTHYNKYAEGIGGWYILAAWKS